MHPRCTLLDIGGLRADIHLSLADVFIGAFVRVERLVVFTIVARIAIWFALGQVR